MADEDKKLMASRLTNASAGSLIDDSFRNIEAALRLIFGIPADTVMSEAMSIVAGGDVTMTGALTLAGAPTADLHAATKLYVDSVTAGGILVLSGSFSTTSLTYVDYAPDSNPLVFVLPRTLADMGVANFKLGAVVSNPTDVELQLEFQDVDSAVLGTASGLNDNQGSTSMVWSDEVAVPDTSAQMIVPRVLSADGDSVSVHTLTLVLYV